MKQKVGKKEKKEKGAHFYSNPMSMNLDDELGSNEMKMKRAARLELCDSMKLFVTLCEF